MIIEKVYFTRDGFAYPMMSEVHKTDQGVVVSATNPYNEEIDTLITESEFDTLAGQYLANVEATIAAARAASNAAAAQRAADLASLKQELINLGLTPGLLYVLD